MPDLNDLGLTSESVGEVDYNAPEPGSFPPAVPPGVYDFQFKLNSDPWDKVTVEGHDYMQVVHDSVTTYQGEEKPLNFQRASFYKHPKMPNSMAADLIRALNIRAEGQLTKDTVKQLFEEAEATGRHFKAEVGWRHYCDHSGTGVAGDAVTISTRPRKKKGDVAWPMNGDNTPVLGVKCPKCGKPGYGNAEILRYLLPGS